MSEPRLLTVTSADIVASLSASALPVSEIEVFDAETDPNNLLGRPGQYVLKVSWTDQRLSESLDTGGTVEVFLDADAMQRRADYVEGIGKSSPVFLQWIFVDSRLGAVLRVGKDLTPDEAAEYRSWLEDLSDELRP